MNKKIIAVAGPTASGKTALSVKIALEFGGEVVSCDSMQIYKGMNIGTAKPDENEKMGVAHHMMDFLNPTENYNVVDYKKDAEECVDDILKRGRLPILAGGTGLYMDSVLNNTAFSEKSGDEKVRAKLETDLNEKGIDFLYNRLKKVDPEAAEKIHPNNQRRVLRALEIFDSTGKTMTQANFESKRP